MPYDRLARSLADAASPIVTTLPDGSIDHYCTVVDEGTGECETREAFGNAILGERSSFRFRVDASEPGGQAVNAAKQLHALGGAVTCYGYVDAPVFDAVPFETVSMGAPAHVNVFTFRDRDAMFVKESAVREWTLTKLRRVGSLDDVFDVDAVCCSNWASIAGLESAFHQLGDMDLQRVPFVVDPGDIVGFESADVDALLEALAALQDTFDVVYNPNRREVRATTAHLPDSFESDLDRLATIRAETGISAAVMHAREEAAVVTADDKLRVSNYQVDDPERHTGGGDRFTGGLGYALACGWDWELALACGNACAVHYVDSGRTGSVEDLVAFVDAQPTVES